MSHDRTALDALDPGSPETPDYRLRNRMIELRRIALNAADLLEQKGYNETADAVRAQVHAVTR